MLVPGVAEASTPPDPLLDRDTRNEQCAQLAIAAKEGRSIERGDARLQACAAASHTVCKRTREFLEEGAATRGQNLLGECTGPEEVALSAGQLFGACKLGVFLLNACINGLPTSPSLKDVSSVSRPPVIRLAPSRPGISGR
jgi:hypothetical protein